jgi:CheY-like chemotaxis protein
VGEGGAANEKPLAPSLLIGERDDGSHVEFLAFPAIIADGIGKPAGVLEILIPLSSATMPRGLIHGLSNAVGVILGNVDLAMLETSPGGEMAEYLEEIRSAALRAREQIRPAPPAPPLGGGGEEQQPKARVMCIDDDDAFLLLAGRSLLRHGYRVSTFTSPEDALLAYAREPLGWDLIVTDNNLLGREGCDVAREFLTQNPHLPVCIASGDVDEHLQQRAREVGVFRVIQKPGTVAEFAGTIRDLLAEFTPPTDRL